jgi:regulator of sirC expression with transglutaminase-like and TPR domain
VQELTALLAGLDLTVPLDFAALQLATIEFPLLDVGLFLRTLDSYASELNDKVKHRASGREFIAAANSYFFDELGFEGNEDDYYDPWNSCLNEVLARRKGIPITLSAVYMEIARRLDRPVFGIGLPGHFIVKYDDGDFAAFLDPFHGGRELSAGECRVLAAQTAGVDIAVHPAALLPVTSRQMLMRMLNNLRVIYFKRGAHDKALEVLNLLIAASPESPEEYKQRGLIHIELRRFRQAAADLEKYLFLTRESEEAQEVEEHLKKLRRYLANLQ